MASKTASQNGQFGNKTMGRSPPRFHPPVHMFYSRVAFGVKWSHSKFPFKPLKPGVATVDNVVLSLFWQLRAPLTGFQSVPASQGFTSGSSTFAHIAVLSSLLLLSIFSEAASNAVKLHRVLSLRMRSTDFCF